MLKLKTTYIRGLLVVVALFGLVNCKNSSKTASPIKQQVVPPVDDGGTTAGGDSDAFIDPTLSQPAVLDIQQANDYLSLENGTPIFTGAKSAENLRYTDNNFDGQDSLMEQLKNLLQQKFQTTEEFNLNRDFARSLNLTQVIVDAQNPSTVRANFKIVRNKKEIAFSMTGTLKDLAGKYGHVEERVAILKSTSGPKDVIVRVQCMDVEPTCHHMVLRFIDKSQQQVREAAAIYRTTPVTLSYFSSYEDQDSNDMFTGNASGFYKFIQTLKNSSHHQHGPKKYPLIKSMILESSAVVFGRSQFTLFTRIARNKTSDTILPVQGPLLRNKNDNAVGDGFNLPDPHTVTVKDAVKSAYDPILNQLQNISLIQNNGLGSIQLMFNFGADQQQNGDIILTISRTDVQLRALSN